MALAVNSPALRTVNEVGHPIIVAAYLLLGVLFLFIRLPGERETMFARAGALLFFWGCGLHHVDMWLHGIDGSPLAFGSIHHTLGTLLQVVGAPMFVLAAGPYIRDLFTALRDLRLLRAVRMMVDDPDLLDRVERLSDE